MCSLVALPQHREGKSSHKAADPHRMFKIPPQQRSVPGFAARNSASDHTVSFSFSLRHSEYAVCTTKKDKLLGMCHLPENLTSDHIFELQSCFVVVQPHIYISKADTSSDRVLPVKMYHQDMPARNESRSLLLASHKKECHFELCIIRCSRYCQSKLRGCKAHLKGMRTMQENCGRLCNLSS